MKKTKLPKSKIFVLFGILVLYIVIAGSFMIAVSMGIIQKAPPRAEEFLTNDVFSEPLFRPIGPKLESAQLFFEKNFVKENGHINLYISGIENTGGLSNNDLISNNYLVSNNKLLINTTEYDNTNSEALSYYLFWKAQANDKEGFDKGLEFIEKNMVQPRYGYLMWRLDSLGRVVDDGSNIASDADLRVIKALLIAEEQWKDERYTTLINKFALGLEKVAITNDGYLAPYGGMSGESSVWTANEVWLSYSDFTVFRELGERRGEPWKGIYKKMKTASLNAQLENGLYNSMLTKDRLYGNGIDGGGYSINSMWMMVRNAESNDVELMRSARKSLQFYKSKFIIDNELYAQYGSNGDPLSPADTPWVYALVGRAAIALNDKSFSESMMQKLIEHQVTNNQSALFGAFPEDYGRDAKVGQFTMQESIITLQEFDKKNKNGWVVKK